MPQALPFAAAFVASNGLAIAGATTATQAVVAAQVAAVASSAVVQTVVSTAIVVGASYAVAKLNAPQMPRSSSGSIERKDTLAPRFYSYGKCKVSGPVVLLEVNASKALIKITAVGARRLASMDLVIDNGKSGPMTAGPGGAGGDYTYQDWTADGNQWGDVRGHLGQDNQPADSMLLTYFPSPAWTSDHRLRSIPYIAARLQTPSDGSLPDHPAESRFQQAFPTGEPTFGVVGGVAVYDPRRDPSMGAYYSGSGAQDKTDPDTWEFSDNQRLVCLDWLTWKDGYAKDWARIDWSTWVPQINMADDAIPLKAGGTEPRYRIATVVSFDEPKSRVLRRILDAGDQQLFLTRDGLIGSRGGIWQPPTVSIDADKMLEASMTHGVPMMDRVNEFQLSATLPSHDYAEVELESWSKTDDPEFLAGIVRRQPLQLLQVPSNSQAQRLAKIRMAKINPKWSGQIRTNFKALDALGEAVINLSWGPTAVSLPLVKNWYNPALVGAANSAYNATTGTDATIQAFFKSGKHAIVAGQPWTANCDAAPDNMIMNLGVHYWNPDGSHNSYDTSAAVLSSDFRTYSGTAPITGFVAWNFKYASGSPPVYSSSNVIPPGWITENAPFVMLTHTAKACVLSAYGASGTINTPSGAPDLSDKLLIAKHGEKFFYLFHKDASENISHRVKRPDATVDYNPDLQFASWVDIPNTASPQELPGWFATGYAPTPVNPDTYYIESDQAPAHRMNGVFLGGNHGIPCWSFPSTAHGRTTADTRGGIFSQAGVQWFIAQIHDANHIEAWPVITGADDLWTLNTSIVPTTANLVHVTGASNTADIVVTGTPVAHQLRPGLQDAQTTFSKDGGARITESGIYEARSGRTTHRYRIPNAKLYQDRLIANRGGSTEILFSDPANPSQVSVAIDQTVDRHGIYCQKYSVTALQAYVRNQAMASQHQALTFMSGESLWFYAEGLVASVQSGISNTGGTPLNFTAIANVTSNTLEYYFNSGVWIAGSHWSDGVQHPPTLFAFIVKNSGGTVTKRFGMINSDFQGRTKLGNTFASMVGLLSQFEKFYPTGDWARTVAANDSTTMVGGFGPTDPAVDPQAIINISVPLGDGKNEFRWATANGALSNYAIPLSTDDAGKRITIGKRSASITVHSTVVSSIGTITVSTSGPGSMSLLLTPP